MPAVPLQIIETVTRQPGFLNLLALCLWEHPSLDYLTKGQQGQGHLDLGRWGGEIIFHRTG